MNKAKKRILPSLAALMMIASLFIPIIQIKASAEAAPIIEAVTSTGAKITMSTGAGVVAGSSADVVLTSASLLDYVGWAYLGYKGASSLSNSLKNGNIQDWAQDKVMEWQYGYNQAQLYNANYSALLTYNDMRQLADLLDEAYPDGTFQVVVGDTCYLADMPNYMIPVDTPVYITPLDQNGDTALTYRYELFYEQNRSPSKYISGPDVLKLRMSLIQLPEANIVKSYDYNGFTLPTYHGEFLSGAFTFDSVGNLVIDVNLTEPNEDDYRADYDGHKTNVLKVGNIADYFNDTALVSTIMPTYIPQQGIDVNGETVKIDTDRLRDVPYGMDLDDPALEIPLSDTDKIDDPADKPGKIPEKAPNELIENAPDVTIEGDLSNFKMPSGIASVFPFCLPFDFYNGIRLFAAQPKTPVWEIPITIEMPPALGGGYFVNETITIDFGKFEKIARLSRALSTAGFLFFLIQLSTRIVKGAGA